MVLILTGPKYCFRMSSFNSPAWNFKVYPARRPLLVFGGPHSRVRESKLELTTFRNDGGPGTKNQIRMWSGPVEQHQ